MNHSSWRRALGQPACWPLAKGQPWPPELPGALLAFAIGLHLPRSFSLLYVLAAWILWRSRRQGGAALLAWLRPWWPLLVITALYSLSYASGMLQWRLWQWPADRSDLINAVLLPSLLLLAGLAAGRLVQRRGWQLPVVLLLSYSLGSLLYALLALAVSRQPWWDLSQGFAVEVQVPWGNRVGMNVRSVEQNAIPALLLLPVGLVALLPPRGQRRRRGLLLLTLLPGLLGLHAILAFQGRLGILALLLACLPLAAAGLRRLGQRRAAGGVLLLALAAASGPLHRLVGGGAAVGWAQGLCDERFSLYLAILARAGSAPWGGRQLVVPYQLCDGSPGLLAPEHGSVGLAHNVILDVFRDTGLLPALLLLAALLPLLLLALRGFLHRWHDGGWSWPIAWLWGWFVLLLGQWCFSPLLYADGLLFALSFFVIAVLAAGLRPPPSPAGASDLRSDGRPDRARDPEASAPAGCAADPGAAGVCSSEGSGSSSCCPAWRAPSPQPQGTAASRRDRQRDHRTQAGRGGAQLRWSLEGRQAGDGTADGAGRREGWALPGLLAWARPAG